VQHRRRCTLNCLDEVTNAAKETIGVRGRCVPFNVLKGPKIGEEAMKVHTILLIAIVTGFSTPVLADPLHDVINWCSTNTGAPTHAPIMAIKMPDGNLRGTRSPATLTAEARQAKAKGDCNMALQWLCRAG
jgi:hypothetical protein